MERVVAVDGDRLLDEAFDGLELVAFLVRDETDRGARLAGAGGAADAVHVALGLEGQLHVDDAGDLGDIDAAAGEVGRHEGTDLAGAEALEGARALVLRLVGMDGRAGDVRLEELLDDAVCAVAHLGEDDDLVPLGMLLEKVDEERVLLGFGDEHHLLVDLLDGRRFGGDCDLRGVRDELAREAADRIGHRGGEEERLAGLRQLRDDAADVWQEAHVEHAVRLVEDEALDLVEVDDALGHQVDEAAGARDHRLGALLDLLDLAELADAAEDAGERKLDVL